MSFGTKYRILGRLSKFFKDCLPQNLLGPLLNTLSHLSCHLSGVSILFSVLQMIACARQI